MATELFLKLAEPQVGYDLSRDLSDNPDEWIPEVLQHVLTRHPYLRDALAAPEFDTFDETNQSARGQLVARQGNTVIQIPIIINDGRLAPVDVFLHDGRPYPLTERRMAGVFFNPELGEALVSPPGRLLSRRFTTGLEGLTQDLEADDEFDDFSGKAAALVDLMANADEPAKTVLAESMMQDAAVFDGLKRHFGPLLGQVFAKRASFLPAEVAATAVQVEPLSPGRYRVTSLHPGQPTQEQYLSGGQVLAALDKLGADRDLLDRADRNGLATQPLAPTQVALEPDLTVSVEKVAQTGAYTVYGPTMKAHDAIVYCQLTSLDGRPMPGKLVAPVAHESHGLQGDVVGVPCPDAGDVRQRVEARRPTTSTPPATGDPPADCQWSDLADAQGFGPLIAIRTGDAATEPIQVVRCVRLRQADASDERICVHGLAGLRPVTLVATAGVQKVASVRREHLPVEIQRAVPRTSQVYAVPTASRPVVLGPTRVPYARESGRILTAVKMAAQRASQPVRLTCANGRFGVDGDVARRLGPVADLAPREARLVLAALGCDEEVADRALRRARQRGALTLLTAAPTGKSAAELPIPATTAVRKTPSENPLGAITRRAGDRLTDQDVARRTATSTLVRSLRGTRADRARLAAYLPGAYGRALGLAGGQATDPQGRLPAMGSGPPGLGLQEAAVSLLSLDFLREDNVEAFVASLPLFEQVVSLLGQMLLALRVHPDHPFLEEACVREALQHLEQVVAGLDGLSD